MSNRSPLDYAQVQPRRPIRWGMHIAIALQAAVYLAVPMLILLLVVPRFEATFRDFSTSLPWGTKLVLYISRWAGREYGWLILLPLVTAAVLPGLILDLRGTDDTGLRLYRWVLRILLLLLAVALSLLMLIACYLPMFRLISTISGAAKQ